MKRVYTTEVFSSDGSLAVMRDGQDVAHVVFPENDNGWRADEAEKTYINEAIDKALGEGA